MAQLTKGSPEFLDKVSEMKTLSAEAKALEAAAKEADMAFRKRFLEIPNLPDSSVPSGHTEADNEVVKTWGYSGIAIAKGSFPYAVPHYDIPWFESRVDFARGVKVTGAGFPFYVGEMSQMVRALINYFL